MLIISGGLESGEQILRCLDWSFLSLRIDFWYGQCFAIDTSGDMVTSEQFFTCVVNVASRQRRSAAVGTPLLQHVCRGR